MRKYNIPKKNTDLRRYAFRRYFARSFGFVVYVAVWAIGYAVYLGGPLAKPLEPLAMAVFCLAVVTSGWMIFRMGDVVFKRTVCGRLISQKITRSYDRGMNRRAGASTGYNTYVNFCLLDKGEKKRRVKLQLFEDGYGLYYKEGDMIVSLRGLNYPLCIESEKNGEHICAVCGARRHGKDCDGSSPATCESCGHSLIDVRDLTEEEL